MLKELGAAGSPWTETMLCANQLLCLSEVIHQLLTNSQNNDLRIMQGAEVSSGLLVGFPLLL